MTKFEEEVKRPANGPLTELNNNMQEVFSQYRKMRQYADYLEYESKQKDERILKLENENSFMRDERTTFDSNGMAVEPKLQQQALPVVKDFVAEWFEENKKDLDFAIFDFCVELDKLDETSTKFESWFDNSLNNPIETLISMKGGYTIEKPQLFYLKHIDMSKTDKEFDWYLMNNLTYRNGLSHNWVEKDDKPQANDFKFTQLEIDSMQTGSYEQIEVAE